MSSEQVFISVSSAFPYQSLIHHCSTLTNHRAISLRRRHVDISSVSRKLHLGVVFGSVEFSYIFHRATKYKFLDSAGFSLKSISACSSFPTQRVGVTKALKTLRRGGPHRYTIITFVEGYLGLNCILSDSRRYSGSLLWRFGFSSIIICGRSRWSFRAGSRQVFYATGIEYI